MTKNTYLSPGVYRTPSGGLTHVPSGNHVISSKGKKKNDSNRTKQIRGKEVSIREAASDAQVIYGLMRVGGVYTYIETSKDSKAYLVTGSNNNQIAWIAKAAGASGNSIFVTITCTGTQGSITVNTVGNEINVRVKSSGGVSQSTANQVIAAVQADATTSALVRVHKGDGDGTGNVQQEDRNSLGNGGGTWLHQVITLAGHEIQSVDSLYLDERLVTFGHPLDHRWAIGDFDSRVFMAINYGGDDQTVIQDLQGQVGSAIWSDDHRQRGCAHVYLICRWNASMFPNGMPEASFLVKGKKCYDFRTATTAWTQNAALIIADFLMNTKYGLGVPLADMDVDSWSDAADVCDETVSLVTGGTEPRYQINGVFDTSETPQTILEQMVQAIAGDLVYQGGKWFCYPGKYRSPSLTFTEDDFRGPISVTTLVPRRDRFNAVKGTYVSPSANYNEADYPIVQNSGYAAQDGGVVWANIPQDFVTSPSQCQRIAKIELERIRQGIGVEVELSARALNLQLCDTINLTVARYGWTNKVFEVRELSIEDTLENGIIVTVKLLETASGIYTWSAEETTVDLAPNTNLPNPLTVGTPTDLILTSGTAELYLRGDGTVFSRIKAVWTAPDDEFVSDGGYYELQYKRTADSSWQNITNIPGENNFTYILDVEDNISYDVRVRAVNVLGVLGSWLTVSNHIVQGKSVPPANVSSFAGSVDSFGIQLEWSAVEDLDVREYEVRFGSDWSTATLVTVVRGTKHRIELKTAGNYTFLVKAIDTSGNYSASATSAMVLVTGPGAPVVTSSFDGSDVVLSWTPGVGLFAVDSYEIRYGDTYAGSTVLGEIKGTVYRVRASWGGVRTFWVTARDVASNLGTPATQSVTVVLPGSPQNLAVEPLDNYALLRWTAATSGSLPVVKYRLYKGTLFDSATFLGDVGGTFAAQFELEGGTYTYWLVAVDSADNESVEVSVSVLLDEPPDFIFLGSHVFDADDVTEIHKVLIEGTPYRDTELSGQPMGLLLGITYA